MPSFAATFPRPWVSLILGATLLLAGGCSQWERNRAYPGSATPSGARPTTALVIVIQYECTEAEYLSWREQIVSYLVERGYILGEAELIADPAEAQRVIRAIVRPDGFTLSIFNAIAEAGPPANLEITDILYPADPYFVLGFYYFGEIGPRRLPPRPPHYRPHPHPPGQPPPPYPRYDHDRHWPRFPRSDDRDHHRRRPVPPPSPDSAGNPPTHPPPGDPGPPPSADHPPRPPRATPPTPPPGRTTPRLAPSGRREQPRDPLPPAESGTTRTPPAAPGRLAPPPPAKPLPAPEPAKPEKTERADKEKHPHRPEHER